MVPSAAVIEIVTGQGVLPSKWPHNPLASMASWKRKENIAQFMPEESSLGMEDGKVSARVVTEDIAIGDTMG